MVELANGFGSTSLIEGIACFLVPVGGTSSGIGTVSEASLYGAVIQGTLSLEHD